MRLITSIHESHFLLRSTEVPPDGIPLKNDKVLQQIQRGIMLWASGNRSWTRSNPSYNVGHRPTVSNGENQKKKHHRGRRRYGCNFADFVSKGSWWVMGRVRKIRKIVWSIQHHQDKQVWVITECYKVSSLQKRTATPSKTVRKQIISIMANVSTYEKIRPFISGLTKYMFCEVRKYSSNPRCGALVALKSFLVVKLISGSQIIFWVFSLASTTRKTFPLVKRF